MAGDEQRYADDLAGLLMYRQARLADAQLKLAEGELRAQRIGLARARTGVALRLALLLLVLILAGLIVAAVIAASRSERLIVDPFDVPQALAVTGASGEALAAAVADELNRTKASGDVAAEAARRSPLDALYRLLGRDRHIGGSVIGLEDGLLRLTIRGDGIQPRSFTGQADDVPEIAALAAEYVRGGGVRSRRTNDLPEPEAVSRDAPSAEAESLRHDHQAARRALLRIDPADPLAGPTEDLVLGLRELDLGRADRAVPPLERFDRAVRAQPELARQVRDQRCYLALAYARLGRSRDAFRLLATEPGSARCAAFRGDVLALAGNWRKASRAYRDAMAMAPSSPVPSERAGAALLARDEPEAASRLFRAAITRMPDWADPHFGLAEAMMQLGRFGEAEQHYRTAAQLAPRWGALHVSWGEALWRLGRQQEARSIWAKAGTMDLGPAAKARLQQLLAFSSARPGERAETAQVQARLSASSADLSRRFVTVTFVPMSVMV